jgi:hypothetical protein
MMITFKSVSYVNLFKSFLIVNRFKACRDESSSKTKKFFIANLLIEFEKVVLNGFTGIAHTIQRAIP